MCIGTFTYYLNLLLVLFYFYLSNFPIEYFYLSKILIGYFYSSILSQYYEQVWLRLHLWGSFATIRPCDQPANSPNTAISADL